MNTTAAALQAHVTTATIRTWARRGIVAATKTAGRWFIDAASLAHRIAIAAMRTRKATVTQPATPDVPWDDTHPDRALLNRAVKIGVPVSRIIEISSRSELESGRGLRRREEGAIRMEIEERRAHLATPRQVDYILDLLAYRDYEGDTTGFYEGPTEREEIELLTRSEASTYIDSLKGNY